MKSTFKNTLRHKQKGMTFLEVIVSFLVVGFGLAMTVSMLQASNRYGASAEYRAIAMREMQTIVDQMRANPLGYEVYVDFPAKPTLCSGKTIPDTACPLAKILQHDAIINAYAIAQGQKNDWMRNLARRIPQGGGEIRGNIGTDFEIEIFWVVGEENQREENQNINDSRERLTVNFSL